MGIKCAVGSATVCAAILESLPTFAQVLGANADKSSNTLSLAASRTLRNLLTLPSLLGASVHTNDLPPRSTAPNGPNDPNSGTAEPENLRGTLLISVRFNPGCGTGLGDTNLFDTFSLSRGDAQSGVGAASAYDLVIRIDAPDEAVLDGSRTFPELQKH